MDLKKPRAKLCAAATSLILLSLVSCAPIGDETPFVEHLAFIWKKTWEDPVAFYTFVLGVFTALLSLVALFQVVLLLRADRTARDAAEAAKRSAEAAKQSADALISAERARLHVLIEEHNLDRSVGLITAGADWDGEALLSTRPMLSFYLKNLGKTAALVTEIGYRLSQEDEHQRKWDIPMAVVQQPVIDGNERSLAVECPLNEAVFKVDDARAVMDGSRPLYFYGQVTYVDAFNRRHTYFWRYQNFGPRFIPVRSEESS